MLKFVGLHAHSGVGSIADGLGYPSEHFDYAQKNGMNSMAITDHGNCNAYGYMAEYASGLKSKGNPFKVIYGIEAYLHPSLSEWKKVKEQKEAGDEEVVNFIENEVESKGKHYDPIKRRHHLVLVAQNQTGLRNIFKLVTRSYREGFYRMPRIDFSMLKEHSEGLFASSACLAGLGSWSILKDQEASDSKILSNLENELTPLMEIFGKDRFFLEIQANKLPEQQVVNKYLIKLAQKTGFKNLATCDSHYCNPDLWREREIYRILGRQKFGYTNLSMEDLPRSIDELKCELYPKNGDQLFETFMEINPDWSDSEKKLITESIERSAEIAETIEYLGPDGEYKLPKYKGVKKDVFEELKCLCMEKLVEKNLNKDQVYIERLVKELKVIKSKNFSIYFTVLYEAIDKLKKHMIVGPGRGSGAGSLVCYLLGITDLDPIRNDLLFERFLSEARQEYPDIDNDVEDRDAAREILAEKFGADNVIPVSNFNTLKLKSLIKDLGRLNDIPYEEVNAVTRVMEEEARPALLDEVGGDQKFYEFTLDGALRHSPTFRKFIEKYPKMKDGVSVLYKQVITLGRHAGGMVICEDASTSMPIIKAKGGVDQTPWSEGLTAKHLEQWGLVKYDFLGLGTLRIIKRAIELILREKIGIKNPTHEDVRKFYEENLHPEKVLDGDEKVFENIYQKGKFPGVFQFSEQAVQNFCVRAVPESVGDIAAITSIWRPGPLKGHADKYYISAKRGQGYSELGHPILEKILGPTYGVLIYQEQFMQLAHELAGYSLEDSDKLRKLLVKPVTTMAEEMKKKREEERIKFIDGCMDKGLSLERSERLWDEEILGFISYGFNKSHAVSYAYVSYQCVHGQTKIYDWDRKEYTSVAKAFKEGNVSQIACFDEKTGKTIPGKIKKIIRTTGAKNKNLKMCFKLKTNNGKTLLCSKDHPILTDSGEYKNLENLKVGDRIAAEKHNLNGDKRFMPPSKETRQKISQTVCNHWKSLPKTEKEERMAPMQKRARELHEDNKVKAKNFWASLHSDEKLKRIQKMQLAAMPYNGFAKRFVGRANCGHMVYSSNELAVCNWLHENGLEHSTQIPLSTFGFADFKCKGIYIEFDGMGRKDEYFEKKYGDEPYVVITNKKTIHEDLNFLLQDEAMVAGDSIEYEEIVSIEPYKETVMYDISMESAPHNFLANNIVVHNCAWLLHYHENQWLRAYLEVDADRDKAVADVVSIGYKMGKPDIMISSDSWKIEDGIIYPALSSIKGIGNAGVVELVEKRTSHNFVDFYDFMWEIEEKTLKNGKVKTKRNWRWSKFNKRAFDALIKVEGFNSFDIVGLGKLFENYKEMYEFFIGNYDAIKRGKIELFDNIPKMEDWEQEEKIDLQQEILGSFDKSLLFTQEVLDFFEEENILPLSDLSETVNMYWFIVRNVKNGTTSTGKPYWKISISDLDDKLLNLNYFGYLSENLKRGSVYIAPLFKNNGWINIPYGQQITKAS